MSILLLTTSTSESKISLIPILKKFIETINFYLKLYLLSQEIVNKIWVYLDPNLMVVTQPKGGLWGSIPPGSFKYLEGSTG
jgi:hypothetical protein